MLTLNEHYCKVLKGTDRNKPTHKVWHVRSAIEGAHNSPPDKIEERIGNLRLLSEREVSPCTTGEGDNRRKGRTHLNALSGG